MIDAHFHIWQLARGDYGWLTPALGPIYRDVALGDWRRASGASGITGGILVQAAATEAETRFLLQQARDAADVLGVVGWVDLLAPDAARRVEALAREPKLVGLRPMLQDIADPDWILQDAAQPALQAMVDCGLSFDALIKPVHLTRILALARRIPGLRIVVDHGAKPDIANRQWQDWASGIAQLGRTPQVFCKLSGLSTEAGPGAEPALLEPYVRHLLACFGPGRLLWGSDWPVLEMAATYGAWHRLAVDLVARDQHGLVFGQSARQAYQLG